MIESAIRVAIHQLISKDVSRRDIIIAMPGVVERALVIELQEKYFNGGSWFHQDGKILIEGIEIYPKHPHNEIVVYHQHCCYYEDLKIIIPMEVINKTYTKKTKQ